MKSTYLLSVQVLLIGAAAVFLSGCRGPNLIDRMMDPWYGGICGLIVLILNIIAIFEILQGTWTPGRKLLWILLIIFFPILGLILYYFIARE